MNRYLRLLPIVLLFALGRDVPAQQTPSAEIVMQRVVNKLASARQLGYRYTFDYNYPARNSRTVVKSQAYLDLQPADRKDGFKFQFIGEDRVSVYNGSERFITDKPSKKLHIDSSPTFDRLGDIVLHNSPLSLKYALPKILADKTIRKKASVTSLNARKYYLLEFYLHKRAISSASGIIEVRADQSTKYVVTVDAKTSLPIEVVQTNDKNDEILKTTFAGITDKPVRPKPLSWYFSAYKGEYQVERREKLTLIEPGKASPDFKLGTYGSASQTSLDQYKGKPVLIEFWIAHCGFCIAAVPKLNAISHKFRDLQVISINMHDPASTIDFFKNKNKPEFVILTGGDSIAKQYGVEAYPAIVLVGRDGKVVYSSSGLEEKELDAAITENLK